MSHTSFLHNMNLFIRSCIFTMIMWIYIFIQSFLSIFFAFLPLRYRYAMITFFLSFMIESLRIICKVDYKVEGLENIPKDRTGIILSKHQSTWETFFFPTIFHEPAIILKKELLWVPFFGWGLATIDPIAIDRSQASSAMEQIIKKGKHCLEQGRWVLIFPEGTRIPVGKVGKYRLGGARLAVATGAPVIPVAHNAGIFWPRRKFLKRPGTLRMVIGPLIETTGKTPEQVLSEAKNWIEETVLRL